MMPRSTFLLASVAALALSTAGAMAADYDPPIFIEEAPEYVPVEIGSGWYLRGDIAYTFERSFRDTAASVDDSLFDNEWLGFGGGPPIEFQSFSVEEFPVSGSIGVGYHFNDLLRGELNFGVLANDEYSVGGFIGEEGSYLDPMTPDFGCLGVRTTTVTTTQYDAAGEVIGAPSVTVDPDQAREGCSAGAKASNVAVTGMANGYIDLGTIAGITPYVGAGIGMIYTRSEVSSYANCEDRSISSTGPATGFPGQQVQTDIEFNCYDSAENGGTYEPVSYTHSEYNWMYGLSAGFAYQITPNAQIDVGYHYVNAPDIDYYTVGANGVERNEGIDFHQVKVGLRYALW